jgi:flagella basal body P-ring formation protein FlgA
MLIVLFISLIAAPATQASALDQQVRDAITDAMRDRMGASAEVSIESLTIEPGVHAGDLQAVPEPGSKLGRVIRFTLRSGDARARTGSATARVRVSVPHAHTTRALERGVEITAADIAPAAHDIVNSPLRALPSVGEATHARTMRTLAKDACVAAASIVAMPPVRGGHDVTAVARIGEVEARTMVTASQSGEAGDVIRVVNRQTKRPLKARVISEGLVEIIHE